jgi:hypothetical protein
MIPALDKTHQNPTNQKLTHHPKQNPVAISSPPPPQNPPRHFNSNHNPRPTTQMLRNKKPKKDWTRMAGKADSKRLKQPNDPLRNDKPTTNFPKTKAPHQDFPQKSKNPPPKNFPKSDGTPKATLSPSYYSSSLQFLFS